jgi:hypothetical protein
MVNATEQLDRAIEQRDLGLMDFQFVVTMTKAFAALPHADRQLHFFALCSIAAAVMLLLTPTAVHRLTFGGRDVARFHTIGSWLVTAALAPLGVGIAADIYVATFKMLDDPAIAVAAAAAVTTLCFLAGLWYVLPICSGVPGVHGADPLEVEKAHLQ